MNDHKTFIVTDKNGKGLVSIKSNDPTLVIDTQYAYDLSHLTKEDQEAIEISPRDFDKNGKKRKKTEKEIEDEKPPMSSNEKNPLLERLTVLEDKIQKMETESKPKK